MKEKYKPQKDNLNDQVVDIAYGAAQSYNRQLMLEFGEKDWEKLRLVEEEIEEMDDGQYGVCSDCEERIPEGRLKVTPFATHCVDCLKIFEKKYLNLNFLTLLFVG